MLPDRDLRLLTACVDGELADREQQRLDRLLRESDEARRWLDQLREDAGALRQAPLPTLPIDFSAEIQRTIAERGLCPGRIRKAQVPSWLSPLAPWAAAAAILVVLGATSYLFFAGSFTPSANPEIVEAQPNHEPRTALAPPEPSEAGPVNPSPSAEQTAQKPHHPAKSKSSRIVQASGRKIKNRDAKASPPRAKDETVLTDRLEMFRFSKVDDALPVVVKLQELEQEAIRKQLLTELGKNRNFRLELPCRNGTKAFERVQNAAKAVHLDLLVDKRARERLQLPKLRTNYLVYLEDMTPEELTVFLKRIGAVDRKAAARKPAEAQFDRLVLTAITPKDRKELVVLLGIDPTVKKPESQGSPEHSALVLPYNFVRPSPGSSEIKRFLENRPSPRPGTIRLLLVLRG